MLVKNWCIGQKKKMYMTMNDLKDFFFYFSYRKCSIQLIS